MGLDAGAGDGIDVGRLVDVAGAIVALGPEVTVGAPDDGVVTIGEHAATTNKISITTAGAEFLIAISFLPNPNDRSQ